MVWPPKLRWKWKPVVAVPVVALAGWGVLALMSGEALDRADKAASVVGMLIGLAALMVAVVELPRRGAADGASTPEGDLPSLVKRPSVLVALATTAVGLIVVVVVALAGGGAPETNGPNAASTDAIPAGPAASGPPEASASTTGPSERCASPAGATATPGASPSSEVVRRDGSLVLSPGYYADLDSLCPDWDVTDTLGSADIGNDGTGLARSLTGGVQIAAVEPKAPATFAMCASNTDYIGDTLPYDELDKGDRYCVLTDGGRRSLLTIKQVRGGGDRISVQVQVRTWAQKRPEDKTDYGPWILGGILLLLLFGGGAKKVSEAGKQD